MAGASLAIEVGVGQRARPSFIERFPAYPPAAAGAFVIASFVDFQAPLSSLVRPLVIAVAAVAVLQLLVTLALRRRHVAAFATFAIVGVLLMPLQTMVLLAAIDIALLVGRLRTGRFPRMPWKRISGFADAVVVLVLVMQVATLVAIGPVVPPLQAKGAALPGAPDIYLLLLDGHPRLDTVEQELGVDPGPFRTAMAGLGFDEATAARSNYNFTFLTLASMFNGVQADELVAGRPADYRTLLRAINGGRLLATFRDAGYEFVSIASPFTQGAFQAVDRFIDTGQPTDFELGLLQSGLVPRMLPGLQRDWALEQHRDRVIDTFEALEAVAAEPHHGPRLVFTHVMAPHLPIVFDKEGAIPPGNECYPERCTLWAFEHDPKRFAEHVTYTDQLVVNAVRAILERSASPPVIVVFSDHGLRIDPYDEQESLRNLLMTATPGHPGLFPEDASPVNYLTRLANAYVGTTIALSSEESYWLDAIAMGELGPFSYRPSSADP